MAICLIDGNHQKKIDYRPTVDTEAGVVVLFGSTICITSIFISADELGAVNWPNAGAQYSIPNVAGAAFAVGADVFVDANNDGLAAGGIGKIGVVSREVAAGDEEIWFVHER